MVAVSATEPVAAQDATRLGGGSFRPGGDSAARSSQLRGSAGIRRLPAGAGPLAVDLRELGTDGDGLALADRDLRQRPRGRGWHLGVDLVGRDLEHGFVERDLVALVLQPLQDRPLDDGLAELGHLDGRDLASSCRGATAPRP